MDGDGLLDLTYRTARRIVVSVVGATLIAIGLILVFTPGPAFVVFGMGLAVLAIEFAWARRWLKHLREAASETARRVMGNGHSGTDPDPEATAGEGSDGGPAEAESGEEGARPSRPAGGADSG